MKTIVFRLVFLLVLSVSLVAAHAATRTLTINVSGNGSVARNPTNAAYPNGAVVTLTALPEAGWSFNAWSGDASGSANPLNVTMDADKVITATFSEIPVYALAVSVSGAGGVSPVAGNYLSNSVVQISATPSNGWIFHHWSGQAAGSANPLNVTMSGNRSITAVFVEPPSIVTPPQNASATPGGSASFSVTAGGAGPLSYAWRFNGGLLAGADGATLSLTNVQPFNAGGYDVVVSNPYGSVTSAVATLMVACPGTNVVTVADDAALRSAVSVGGHVRLCFSGAVVLTNTILVTKDTFVDASGVAVVIHGNDQVRLFEVSTNVIFSLTNLALAQGRATGSVGGAAILSRGGLVSLTACVLRQNTARDVNGGAVAGLGGSLSVHDSVFESNTVAGSVSIPPKLVQGGAVYFENGLAQIADSLFRANSLTSDSSQTGGESTAQLNGGALAIKDGTTGVLARIRFLTNRCDGGYTRNGTIPGVGGGAVYSRGTLFVEDCSFIGNLATGSGGIVTAGSGGASGGALDTSGTAHVSRSLFLANAVRGGTGRSTGPSTGFSGADARGGAVQGGYLLITNCTFTGNAAMGGAAGGGSASAGNAYGGAIESSSGSSVLVNVTLATNVANVPRPYGPSGGGLSLGMNLAATTNFPITVRNSVLAGVSNSAWGQIVDDGYNFCSDDTANFTSGSSFNFTDPKLLPLAGYGGLTLTMPPAADSPVVDWASPTDAPLTDQRGQPRPFGAGVDVGAVELGPPVPALTVGRSGGSLTLSFLAGAGVGYRLERSSDLISWQIHEMIAPLPSDGLVTRILPFTPPGMFFRLQSVP